MSIPNNLKYTKEHEWIDVKDGIGTIGITNFAQSELGDIVFVELPNIGDEIAQNDVFGTIEAVKTLADLFSPVTGEIIEINRVRELAKVKEVNMHKKHKKPTKENKGGIISKEGFIHLSNLKKIDENKIKTKGKK